MADSRRLTFQAQPEFIEAVDNAAHAHGQTRAEYARQAVREQLRRDHASPPITNDQQLTGAALLRLDKVARDLGIDLAQAVKE